jgi:CheY-like chemotaxis protein
MLTRQLLAFSRKQLLEPRVVDLNATIAELEKMLRRMIGEDIAFVTKLAPSLYPILVDPGQLQQVIMNLVVNARDAMPAGGELTIESANVDLDETYVQRTGRIRKGPHVMIAVSDTGSGMTPEVQERIFEPFFTTKEAGKGTGLGLSTVYGIVKQSGGDIWVSSELGKGSVFKIYLPKAHPGSLAPRTRPRSSPSVPPDSGTILIVEDEVTVRSVAVKILRKAGYQVLEAASAAEARTLCAEQKEPVRLVLTDMVMPGVSGPELATELKAAYPSLKVLLMSGYTDHALLSNDLLDSGVRLLQKPFTAEGLVRKVREALTK